MRRHDPEPICCDGRCVNGGQCPMFAPGVIDGPHSRRRGFARSALQALAYPLGVLVALGAWLLGPTP